jgi:tight adherence protein C
MAPPIPWLAPALIGGFAVVLGLALLLWQDMRRSERLSARLRMVRSGGGPAEPEPGTGLSPVLGFVTAIGETIARSGALSARTLEELHQTLHVAGFRGEHGLGLFVGTKLLLVIGLPLPVLIAVWLLHFNVPYPTAVAAVAAGVGLLVPDKVVQHLRARYLRALEAGMPDALDMMVICGQAGLGLEASIELW